ncbi:MAG: polymer-forming cytoskeletal protein [Gammaproteobacteria bacterium]
MMETLFGRRNKGRRVLDEVRRFDTLIGSDAQLQGVFEGSDNCIVNGVVKGDCRLQGVLVLGRQATWKGNIHVAHAIISGTVEGDIVVQRKLELTATARIQGSISSPAIAIADGAIHAGDVHMAGQPDIVRFEEKRKSPRD